MKRYTLTPIMLFFLLSITHAQQTTIILHKVVGHTNFFSYAPPTPDDSIAFKIPGDIKYKLYNSYHFYNYQLEEIFRRYKSRLINYDKFIQFEKSYARNINVDTLLLAANIKNYPTSVKTYMVSGLDSSDNEVVLVDINRDGKITADEIFKFTPQDKKNIKKNADTLKYYKNIALAQRGKDGSYRSFNVKITPGPYYSGYGKGDEVQKLTDFGLVRNEYWFGNYSLGKDTLNIYAESNQFSNEIASVNFMANINGVTDKTRFQLKEEWANNKYSFTVDSIAKLNDDKMKLFISYQSPPKKHNDTTFKMLLENVNTDTKESLTQYLRHKNYVMIDYWGTWCGPCIEKIPALKDLNMKYRDKFSLISIAYDFDINSVKKFDIDNDIEWASYYIDRKIPQNLTIPLKVKQYPTFRLYDKTGNLIMEGNTSDDLDKIAKKIAEL
jgi:thiol-disulfide isomerase/thioredoxin